MVIPIIPKATVGELAPRRTFRGRLAANRQLWSVPIIGALVLAIVTGLVIGWALRSDQAGSTAALPVVAEGPARTAAVGDTTVAGLREFLTGEGVTGANRTSGIAAETGRQEYLTGEGSTRSLPSVSTVGAGRQQAELYGIEVRDNGAGTTGDDSESCAYPLGPCNR